jgi:hypothetical protein
LVFVALLLILHFGGSISRYESFVFLWFFSFGAVMFVALHPNFPEFNVWRPTWFLRLRLPWFFAFMPPLISPIISSFLWLWSAVPWPDGLLLCVDQMNCWFHRLWSMIGVTFRHPTVR